MNAKPPSIALTAFLLAATATAQSAGQLDTRAGCAHPGPTAGLRGALVEPAVWVADENDFFAIEIESAPSDNGWAFRADPNKPGWSGAGYFEWINQNQFTRPGSGRREYRIFVRNAGRYEIRIHNRHDNPIVSEGNDCWLRVNGGDWIKAFSNNGNNVAVWNWDFRIDPGSGPIRYTLPAGLNTIEISGRSTGFILDRIHVFPPGFPYQDLSLPISERLRSRPVRGEVLTLEVGDPNDEAGLPPGATQALLFANVLPATGWPCGVTLPGFGPSGGPGEFLLALSPEPFTLTPGAEVWGGPGTPARFALPVPNDAAIVGFEMYVQGALADVGAPRAVLTDAARLTFGDF